MHGERKWFLGIFIIVILILLSYLYYFYNKSSESIVPNDSSSTANIERPDIDTPSSSLTYLKSVSTTTFPAIFDEQQISADKLPAEIAVFTKSGQLVSVSSFLIDDKSIGYGISLKHNGEMISAFINMRNLAQGKFDVTKSLRNNTAGIMVMEGKTYTLALDFILDLPATSTNITIKAYPKNI